MFTLDEWLSQKSMVFNSAYIDYPGCQVYIRKSVIYIDGVKKEKVITIANITSQREGGHVLKKLISDIEDRGYSTYVECVNNPWLRNKLIEYGFVQVNKESGYHFYKASP